MGPLVDLRSVEGAVRLQRDAVLVAGPEALSYLQGQLSQDVEAMGIGDSAPSLLLQPTGKVDAWVRVTRTGEEELALDTDPGYGDVVHARVTEVLPHSLRAALQSAPEEAVCSSR